jgi:replication factor C subunit 1
MVACAGKETGNTKFNAAKEKGKRVLTEKGLLSLVRASVPFADADDAPMAMEDEVQVQPPALPASAAGTSHMPAVRGTAAGASGKRASAPEVDPSVPSCPSIAHHSLLIRCSLSTLFHMASSKPAVLTSAYKTAGMTQWQMSGQYSLAAMIDCMPAAGAQLWVDKWKPKSSADLVGNKQGLDIMRQWLGD